MKITERNRQKKQSRFALPLHLDLLFEFPSCTPEGNQTSPKQEHGGGYGHTGGDLSGTNSPSELKSVGCFRIEALVALDEIEQPGLSRIRSLLNVSPVCAVSYTQKWPRLDGCRVVDLKVSVDVHKANVPEVLVEHIRQFARRCTWVCRSWSADIVPPIR